MTLSPMSLALSSRHLGRALRSRLTLPLVITSALIAGTFCTPAVAQRTLIHAGRLIDGASESVLQRRTIVVENGRIQSVEQGYLEGTSSDEVINLRESTVLPGLIDLHVHLTSQISPNATLERMTSNPADSTIRAMVYAEKTLAAGFTTVRDLGGETQVIVALRNAIDRGLVQGPKIYAATVPLASTGGHGDTTNGLPVRLRTDPGPNDGIVNSVDDARKAVRQRYKESADTIKITSTGGVLSLAKSGQNPQFTIAEIEEIVRTANDYGFIVAAHAHGSEGIRRAVIGGVTTIEHGTYMTEELMELMVKHGTYFVPTISAGKFVADKAKIDGYFPPIIRPKAAAIGPVIAETFANAYRAGVKIAFGTDSGVSPHGANAQEFGFMVEGGMPPMEAIRSATKTASEVLRIDEQVGTITAGKFADIIAVEGDPIENIKVLEQVSFVMKGGKVIAKE